MAQVSRWPRRWRGEHLGAAMQRRGLSAFDLAAPLFCDPRDVEDFVADRQIPSGWTVAFLFMCLGADDEFYRAMFSEPPLGDEPPPTGEKKE
jgi:hypothetical protein